MWLLPSSSKILKHAFKTGDLSTGKSIPLLTLSIPHPELKPPLCFYSCSSHCWSCVTEPPDLIARTSCWKLTYPCLSWQLNPSQCHRFLKYKCITTEVWLHHNHFFPRSTSIVWFCCCLLIYFCCCLKINIKASCVHRGPQCCCTWCRQMYRLFLFMWGSWHHLQQILSAVIYFEFTHDYTHSSPWGASFEPPSWHFNFSLTTKF